MTKVREFSNLLNGSLRRLASINRITLQWVRADGEEEYIGNNCQEWISRHENVSEVATAYSPKYNGATERLKWTLLETARIILLGVKAQRKDLWVKSVYTVCVSQNRLLAKIKKNEEIHGKRLNLKHVGIFRSLACVQKIKRVWCEKFDSGEFLRVLVCYCGGKS